MEIFWRLYIWSVIYGHGIPLEKRVLRFYELFNLK